MSDKHSKIWKRQNKTETEDDDQGDYKKLHVDCFWERKAVFTTLPEKVLPVAKLQKLQSSVYAEFLLFDQIKFNHNHTDYPSNGFQLTKFWSLTCKHILSYATKILYLLYSTVLNQVNV